MSTRFHPVLGAAAAALLFAAAPHAGAQQFATYGSAEASGFGESSAILGTSVSAGRPGWSPVASIAVYTFRFRSGPSTFDNSTAFAPSLGIMHATTTSAVQAALGYAFLSTEHPSAAAIGSPVGTQNSAFVSAQYNYWGDGSSSTQLLGSYSFKDEYLWARGGHMIRIGPSSPISLGGDVTIQGSMKGDATYQLQLGPTLEYRVSQAVRLNAGAGYRTDTDWNAGSGYARVGFLWLVGP
jgi:hypothetical protein